MKGQRYLLLVMALLGVCVCASASAQTPDADTIETSLRQLSAQVKGIADRLDAGDVPDATLAAQLQTLLDYQDEIQKDAQALKSAAGDPGKRLSDLGPPPAEGQPAESDEIAITIPFPQRDLHIRPDGAPVSGSTAEDQDTKPGD